MNALARSDGNTFYFLSLSLLKLPTVVLAVFFSPHWWTISLNDFGP